MFFFVVWYPGSLLIVTAYEVTGQPFLFIAGTVFTPLWALLCSYLYFRGARDDWTARTVTAFGWMILMFIFSALLVKPVYGYEWTSVVNLNVINANWINLVAIFVGGIAAHKTTPPSMPLPPQPKQ
jgi:hypothetical protein